jgi:hypothetical protein
LYHLLKADFDALVQSMTSRQDHHDSSAAKGSRRTIDRYLKGNPDAAADTHLVRMFLLGAVEMSILLPILFYLRFGIVDWFAIAFTIFMVVLCLLIALGFFFQNRTAYHSSVALKSNFADRLGAFWLVACAFGPFFGWVLTAPAYLLTVGSWRWLFSARVCLAVVAPLITAVPLLRYVRGKAALIALPLLVGVTSLPILSCLWVIGDLHDGAQSGRFAIVEDRRTGIENCVALDPASQSVPCDGKFSRIGNQVQVTWLPHSKRVIEVRKL